MYKVFINPGHCIGLDPGAVSRVYGVTEAEIVYGIGELVKGYLEHAGCQVMMLQSDNLCGENPTMPNVCKEANQFGADVFISIHCNAALSEYASGAETLVYSLPSLLGECIQNQLVSSLALNDRGVKVRDDLIVLKHTDMPAALIECGFITNEHDVQILCNQQDALARAIARGVTDYLKEL